MKVPKIHLSRKLMLILGGVLVTLGGTGAAAVYIGADKLLGPSYAELNGLECTEVKTVEIQKKDRFWVRKFITTNEPGDGLTRVKTALRVAKSLQETKKADLVQVVVLDANGPKDRSGMRGRAVGADVIYVPDPSHVPEEVSARVLTARYVDGAAAPNGEFFGERVDMLEDDIQALVARLNDQTDCVKPEVLVPEGDGHGEKAGGHGAADAHGEKAADGHDDAAGHGEADGHGDAGGHGEAEGHGEAPAGEHGEETPVAEHGTEESKGWMTSLMGMVGLGETRPRPRDMPHQRMAMQHPVTAMVPWPRVTRRRPRIMRNRLLSRMAMPATMRKASTRQPNRPLTAKNLLPPRMARPLTMAKHRWRMARKHTRPPKRRRMAEIPVLMSRVPMQALDMRPLQKKRPQRTRAGSAR